MESIDDVEAFRAELTELLAAAEEGSVSSDAVVGLLTAQLAGMRGDVRLPLSMPPERAREFTDEASDHVGERMEVDLLVSEDVIQDLELQLQVFERRREDG
ncbi:hypothetical protein [Halorientalis regularis]|jgi:hypothetical protein|uniref:Uncharacterized protein n=1 Tax=Halorientalis regularis TaxID=660518 RepID=A0A1G7L0W6_9EURY|nr:hypothetical protein [Halorientalis regularis]SDF42740.1 hypothetical protein SAMN05216218_106104 [Halorientalis regularis]